MAAFTGRRTWTDHDNDYVIRCEGLEVGRVYLTQLPGGGCFVWSIHLNGHVSQVPKII
jgi:hypothetical protein